MSDKKNMRVVVRVRPFNQKELEMNQRNIIKVLDKETLIFDCEDDDEEFFFHGQKQVHRDVTKKVKKKQTMDYDDIHDTDSTNDEIFQSCTKPLVVDWLMNGYNCSVFVYGATGAGKTFTMLGNEETPGITFLTMRELFASIEKHSDERKFDIGISYLEIYNEQVMNLLTKSGPLKLREDASGVVVGGLVLKQIHNAEELLKLLALGNLNRTQHPTDANAESSRSHAIFQVHIRMTDKSTSQKRTVKLSMIDLAGSERAASNFKSKTGSNQRFKEGANINKSLLALGNCINKLADGLRHIPYRDSNLTRILKDSLGGNCRTIMIANVSPSSLTYDDTYNTLKYASRAKKIRIQLTKNIVQTNIPKEYLLKKVNEQNNENEKLKERIKMLEAKLAVAGKLLKIFFFAIFFIFARFSESAVRMPSSTNGCLEVQHVEPDMTVWYEKIDMIYNTIKEAQDQYFHIQSKEKLLKFKATFKEFAEKLTKILTLDGSHTKEVSQNTYCVELTHFLLKKKTNILNHFNLSDPPIRFVWFLTIYRLAEYICQQSL
jgi:kinesin family member 18/19